MIYFFILCLAFYDLSLFGINFADFGLIIFLLNLFLTKKIKIKFTKATFILVILIIYIIISYVEVGERDYFKIGTYLTNTLRLLIYLVALLVIPRYLVINNLVKKYIDYSLIIAYYISVLAIIEIISKGIGIEQNFQIPFLTKQYNAEYGKLFRATTFFSEPAHLCFYLTLVLIQYLFYYNKTQNININKKHVLILIVGSFTTFSFGNFPLIFIGIFMYYKYIKKTKIHLIRRYKITFLTFISLLVAIIIFYEPLIKKNVIADRITDISNGEDGSTIHRIYGMHELGKYIIDNETYFGTGWGQKLNYLKSKYIRFDYYYFTGDYSGINNTLVEVLFGGGIAGLLFFLTFIYFQLGKYPILLFCFFILCINGSHLNNTFFWMFLMFVSIFNNFSKTIINMKYDKPVVVYDLKEKSYSSY